jgi:N-acetyl-D-muramate 6-phosphate phosphatase
VTLRTPRAILFDLDGTLANTAPDMLGALSRLRGELGLTTEVSSALEKHISHGAAALLTASLPEEFLADLDFHRQRYLAIYAEHICVKSHVYQGTKALLQAMHSRGVQFGIVTNKPGALATKTAGRRSSPRTNAVGNCVGPWT